MLKKPEWYVIQVISWTEENVKKSLFQRRESFWLEDYILDVYVPTHDVVSVRSWWVKVKKQKNLLPGYILVQMNVTNEAWYIVRNTQGVTGFIGSSGKGAKPIPLLPQEVDRILNSMGMSRVDISKDLTEGKKVKIIAGPFKDMMAKIDSVDLKEQKLTVLVDLFGQETSVEVDMQEVETM